MGSETRIGERSAARVAESTSPIAPWSTVPRRRTGRAAATPAPCRQATATQGGAPIRAERAAQQKAVFEITMVLSSSSVSCQRLLVTVGTRRRDLRSVRIVNGVLSVIPTIRDDQL